MEGQGTAPPPGFYDDGSGQQRWWDGTGWSEQRLAALPTPDSAPTDTSLTAKVLTVLFPIPALFIGFVMGVIGHRNAGNIIRLALAVIVAELLIGFLLAIATGSSSRGAQAALGSGTASASS